MMLRAITFTDEEGARRHMRLRNATDLETTWVMVDGPDDGEYTVMLLRDAVNADLTYSWETLRGP